MRANANFTESSALDAARARLLAASEAVTARHIEDFVKNLFVYLVFIFLLGSILLSLSDYQLLTKQTPSN